MGHRRRQRSGDVLPELRQGQAWLGRDMGNYRRGKHTVDWSVKKLGFRFLKHTVNPDEETLEVYSRILG